MRGRLEVQPTGIAYNVETTQKALIAIENRPEFDFNLDPSHLAWQVIDPVVVMKAFSLTAVTLPIALPAR